MVDWRRRFGLQMSQTIDSANFSYGDSSIDFNDHGDETRVETGSPPSGRRAGTGRIIHRRLWSCLPDPH